MGAVTLWGREHVAYGDIVVRDAGPGSAVALTRGLHPKPYRYTDPNEDVVAAVTGPRAALLVVADGHNGAASSEVAVATVLERLGDDPPPADLDDEEMVRLFYDVGWAVLHATTALDRARRESRTTLSVTLVASGVLQWAAMGDSPVVVADLESAHELTVPTHHFVGWPLPAGQVDRLLQRGRAPLRETAWVAVLRTASRTSPVGGRRQTLCTASSRLPAPPRREPLSWCRRPSPAARATTSRRRSSPRGELTTPARAPRPGDRSTPAPVPRH